MRTQLHPLHLVIGDGQPGFAYPRIELGANAQAGLGGGRTDQIDDGFVAHQRFAIPVQADEREHSMLDLVPLAGPWQVMTHRDAQAVVVGQPLQEVLPGAVAVPVAAATIGADQQLARLRVVPSPIQPPPAPNTLNCKLGGVMADAHIDEPLVPSHVVGAIEDRRARGQARIVVNVYLLRLSLGTPRPPRILKGSDKLLLLRVDRKHRLPATHKALDLPVDVPELLIPFRN